MAPAIPREQPAVVLRSRFRHLRALLAVAAVALVGLTAALAILMTDAEVDTSGSSETPLSAPRRGIVPAPPPGTPYDRDPGIFGRPPHTPYDGDPGIFGPPPYTPFDGDPGIFGPRPNLRYEGDQGVPPAPPPSAGAHGSGPG
jgi:hypothetical protein